MGKGISFYINYHIKKEHIDTWQKAVNNMLEKMSGEENFICAYLNKDANDSTHFTLFERWDEPSLESFIENQLQKKNYRIDYEQNIAKWSKCPCSHSNLHPIEEWHGNHGNESDINKCNIND